MQAHSSQRLFELKIANYLGNQFTIRRKKTPPMKAVDCEGLTTNQCITFEPIISLMNTLFKLSMEIEKEFWDKFEDYFDVYGKQAQKQIDCNLIVFFFKFKNIFSCI